MVHRHAGTQDHQIDLQHTVRMPRHLHLDRQFAELLQSRAQRLARAAVAEQDPSAPAGELTGQSQPTAAHAQDRDAHVLEVHRIPPRWARRPATARITPTRMKRTVTWTS